MEGNSSRKRPNLDPEPNSSLAKKQRNNPKSHEAKETQTLLTTFQKQIDNLEKCLEEELQAELNDLIILAMNFTIEFKKLERLHTTERMQQQFVESYKTRMRRLDAYVRTAIDIRNKANKRQQLKVISEGSVRIVVSLIKKTKKFIQDIKKEKINIGRITEKVMIKRCKGGRTKKSIKRTTAKGVEFQTTLQVLIRARALSCTGAEVGVEVSGVGQLDDVIYLKTKEKKCRFIQIKYMTNKLSPVTAEELFKCYFEDDNDDGHEEDNSLLNRTQEKGKKKSKEPTGLHFLQYLKSYCKIKENPKFENFNIEELTLITNRDIELSTRNKQNELISLLVDKRSDSEKDECLDFDDRRAQKYGLDVENVKALYLNILLKKNHNYLPKKIDSAERIIDEFLKKIHIVVNYPDSRNLSKRIFKEVFHENVFIHLKETIFESYMLYTEIKLLQKPSEFISNFEWKLEINKVKKFIYASQSDSFTASKVKEVLSSTDFNIRFEHETNITKDINQFIKGNGYQVLECTGETVMMNSIKIIHILKTKAHGKFNYILCEYNNLFTADCLLKAFCDGDCGLLVVICQNIKNNEEISLTDLGIALNNSKKMIIVSEGKNIFTSSLEHLIKNKYLCKHYEHGYKYLTPSCKKELHNKQIIFQKREITFGELINEDLAENAIDDPSLWNILNKTNPEIQVSDDSSFCSPGYSNEYYITQQLYQYRNTIKYNKLKQHLKTNVFLVMGHKKMLENEMKKVFLDNNIGEQFIQKWDDQTEYQNGIVLCNYDMLSQIVKRMSSQKQKMHFIFMNEYKILLLVDSTEEHFAENNLIDKDSTDSQRIVVIAGDLGVGKSTKLTRIANITRTIRSSTWVARVVLRQTSLFSILENTTNLVSQDDAISCVSKMIFTSKPPNLLEQKLIKEGLKCSYKQKFRFVLLLDGFDEINKDLQDKLIILVKTLRDHCNVDKIWITTKDHKRVKLETELEVSSYFLKPLNEEDQVSLMASYWQNEIKKISTVTKTYDELCLDARVAIQQFKSSVNDEGIRQFTENPLHLRMLADILFNEDCKINGELKIFDLYEIFVQQKFSIYRRETAPNRIGDQGGSRSIRRETTIEDKLFENEVRLILEQFSVKSILKNHKTYKLPGMDAYERFKEKVGTSESELALSKVGLLILKNHDFDFIYPSFAQFFFGKYVMKNILKCHYNIKKLWVTLVLRKSSFQSYRMFLDQTLGRLEEYNPEELEKMMNELVISLTNILIKSKRNNLTASITEILNIFSHFHFKVVDKKRYKLMIKKNFKSRF